MTNHEELANRFHSASGSSGPLRIAVAGSSGGDPLIRELDFPFAIIGNSRGCDIVLAGREVSFRHAYLQMIQGRLYCVDLGSRSGTLWGDENRKHGWILPGESIQIGRFTIQHADDETTAGDAVDFDPMDRDKGQFGPLPQVELEFLNDELNESSYPVTRMLTLIGRRPACKLRLDSKTVSSVHCCLLNTPSGPWIVDLLGRNGTGVDRHRVRCAPLENGQVLKLAQYRARVNIGAAVAVESGSPTLSQPAAEPPVVQDEKPEPVASFDPAEVEWGGTLFDIDREGDTLIVIPLIDGGWFRYAKLHTESNSLRHRLASPGLNHLLFDLSQLNYFGSELIGVLVSLARGVTNSGGKAALCNASDKMLEVLRHMSLHKLWPYYATRAEALASMKS